MLLWKIVAAAIKDKNSLIKAQFSKKSSFRNYDLEVAIIKATSHDEYVIDRNNAQIVFSWIRSSPISLRPFVWALSKRVEKTRSWVVAIKGLMLMHGVIHCKVPAVQNMGRLPFDLSGFIDGHSRSSKTWGFNVFIRHYYAFLDQRVAVSFDQTNQKAQQRRPLMLQRLLKVKKWQSLLDSLLKVRPQADNMKVGLIIEAINCVTVEIFDVYSRICSEIAKVLLKILSIGKLEAELALEILQKATKHEEEISPFLEFRKEYYGNLINANELPTVMQILEEDVQQELERIVNGDSDKTYRDIGFMENNKRMAVVWTQENHVRAIFGQRESKGSDLKTIITDKWVVFDEHLNINRIENINTVDEETAAKDLNLVSIDHMPVCCNHYEIPDLITF